MPRRGGGNFFFGESRSSDFLAFLRAIEGDLRRVARSRDAQYPRVMMLISGCLRFTNRSASSAVLQEILPVSAEHLP